MPRSPQDDSATGAPTTLKRNERRTVTVRDGLVVKRYHHPDPIARLFDHARARDEHDVLRELVRRGLAVPAPVEVRHVEGAWELVTEWIPGAVGLDQVLAGRAPWPASRASVARALAELLARAHGIGLDHPDLHAGNVLVRAVPEGACRAWLVDVRRARVRRRLTGERMILDLARVAGAVRETLAPAFRTRFFLHYLRALPAETAARLPGRALLALRVEAEAVRARREHVLRQRLRWTRASSVCKPFDPVTAGDEVGFRAIDVPDGTRVEVRDLEWSELREAWYSAARLCEHGLPSVRPVEIVRTPAPRAVFAVPAGSGPMRGAPDSAALDELRSQLADRGLAVEPLLPESLLVDASGGLVLSPLVRARLLFADEPRA